MSEQIALFEEEKKAIPYLHIVKDGQVVSLSQEEIFDTTRFTELLAVTFVASPKFFFQNTKGFEKVKLIIGIEDNENLSAFTDGLHKLLNIEDRSKFWNEMDKESKERFLSHQYHVRYSQPGKAIHSKIYLMRNPKTNDVRVVMGSANFTQKGFVKENQFEEIQIFDNHKTYYQTYLKRFEDIWQHTLDYIPERFRTLKKEEIIIATDPSVFTEVLLPEIEKKPNKNCYSN